MDRWNIFSTGTYCDEYEKDILDTLKECEGNRKRIQFVAPLQMHRTTVVSFVEKVWEQESYRRATLHLAVYLLDVFMCNHIIPDCRLNLVALTCLYVACKIEENDNNIPQLGKLKRLLANAFTSADIITTEVSILTFFDWHITIPTAATFLDIFLLSSFTQEDYDDMPKDWSSEQMSVEQFARAINETSDIVLQHTLTQLNLCNIRPSRLAACCVAAGRLNIKNMPPWNARLVAVTGYEYCQIHLLAECLLYAALPKSTAFMLAIPAPLGPHTDAESLSEWSEKDENDNLYSSDQTSSVNSEDSDTVGSCVSSKLRLGKRVHESSGDTGEPSIKIRKIVVYDWSSAQD